MTPTGARIIYKPAAMVYIELKWNWSLPISAFDLMASELNSINIVSMAYKDLNSKFLFILIQSVRLNLKNLINFRI